MRISEMDTEQLSNCLVEMTIPVSNIASDKEFIEAWDEIAKTKNKSILDGFAIVVKKFIPIALAKHRADTFKIIGALTGKTVDEIAKQNGLLTIKEARDSFDSEIVDFFASSSNTK